VVSLTCLLSSISSVECMFHKVVPVRERQVRSMLLSRLAQLRTVAPFNGAYCTESL
jgi:hypothetical protein